MIGKKRGMKEFGSIDFNNEYRDATPRKKAAMFDYIEVDVDVPLSWWEKLSRGVGSES